MPNKPSKKDSEPPLTPEEDALAKRVDAMLDPRKPAADNAPAATNPPTGAPIDIFAGKTAPVAPMQEASTSEPPATAPEVPGKLLKQIGMKPVNATPDTAPPAPEGEAGPDEAAPDIGATSTKLDDTGIDKAVADISASEADALLAAQDAANAEKTAEQKPKKPAGPGLKARLGSLVKSKRTWVVVAIVLLALFAVPLTRYKILGLVIKEPVTVRVSDSKTDTPVSNADVSVAGVSAKTNGEGEATVRAPLGKSHLQVTKQYYKTYDSTYSVTFKAARANVQLVATGRQVPIVVVNTITGKPLAGAQIKVLDTTAKTDSTGKATIVLPTTATSDNATVTLSGFNTASVGIQVTSDTVSANTVHLTPSGHIYFLSNLSGTIDVVKTNLDGSGRKTVFAGTGKEDPDTTSLLASRDWRYLVLKSRHDSSRAVLYLIDTSNDTVNSFDTGNADFTLVGWINHNFVYDITSTTVGLTQPGHEIIKSYDADNQQLNQLDQNQAEGTTGNFAYQNFSNFYILSNELAYTTQWYANGGYDISGKSDAIRVVQPGGQNKKDVQSVAANNVAYIQAALYEPQAVYYAFYNPNTDQTAYYTFENQTASVDSKLSSSDFNKSYATYLLSPSGNQTFWTELRDGKNTLFVGDDNAKGAKQIASLSDYAPYGWYGDRYVLVSKSSSELYVMASTGSGTALPLKVTDYYKPAQTFNGYGYGYGGL